MTNWNTYEPFCPLGRGPLSQRMRAEALASFDHVMANREARLDELRRVVESDGVPFGLADDQIEAINQWYLDGLGSLRALGGVDEPLPNVWHNINFDVGIWLGEVLTSRFTNLEWTIDLSQKSIHYQRPVIRGYRKVKNPRYEVDFQFRLTGYSTRIFRGLDVPEPEFLRWIRYESSKA